MKPLEICVRIGRKNGKQYILRNGRPFLYKGEWVVPLETVIFKPDNKWRYIEIRPSKWYEILVISAVTFLNRKKEKEKFESK